MTLIYNKADGKLRTASDLQDVKQALKDENNLLWVDIQQPDDTDVDLLKENFRIHPLTIEDCIMPNARPKLEKFGDDKYNNYLFIIVHAIEIHPEEKEEIKTAELDCCIGKNFLITVHADNIKSVNTTREKIEKNPLIISRGVDFLFCSIIDTMVDNYMPIIKLFDERVDDMSDELFKEPTPDTMNKIYNIKNELMFLRRTVGPQSDTINSILREGYGFITSDNTAYFRDVYDNLVRLNDIIGSSRDIITSALDSYTSVMSYRTNEVMKTLTVIATIVLPLTLIASIYGMNFKAMPELTHRYGYPAILGVMILIAVVMLFYFKRKKWL
jgi:magnesium transporter